MARQGLGVLRAPGAAARRASLQMLGWVVQLFAVWAAMRAFDIEAPLPAAGLVLLLMNVATIFPLWPGNVGLLQAAVALPLVSYGVAYAHGFAFGIGLQAIEVSRRRRCRPALPRPRGTLVRDAAPDAGVGPGAGAEPERGGLAGEAEAPAARSRARLASKASWARRRGGALAGGLRAGGAACDRAAGGRRRGGNGRRARRRARRRVARGGSRPIRSAGRGAARWLLLDDGTAVVESAEAIGRSAPRGARSARRVEPRARRADRGALAAIRPSALLVVPRRDGDRGRRCRPARGARRLPAPTRVALRRARAAARCRPGLRARRRARREEQVAELETPAGARCAELAPYADLPGSGAAGGLGAALAALGAELVPGAALVLERSASSACGVSRSS